MGHTLKQQTTPAEPPAGYTRLYGKADGKIYKYPGGGSEQEIGSGAAHDLGGSSHNADTLSNLNSKISNATLDDASDSRPPTSHGNAAHTGTIGDSSQISDFDTEVGNNTDVAANTAARHTRSHAIDSTDDHSAASDNTDLDVSTSAHGLMSKLPGGTTTFYRGDGNFAAVSGSTEQVVIPCRKASAGTIPEGKAIYIVSWNVSGWLEVEAAKADSESTMPAIGISDVPITNSATVNAIGAGGKDTFDTSSWSVGDELFVSAATAGDLTSTAPTGVNKIQKMCQVSRSHAVDGQVQIFGAGRSNAVPNIAEGKFWLGDNSGVAQEKVFAAEATKFQFRAEDLTLPITGDWAVNTWAAGAVDSNDAGANVLLFDDGTPQGCGRKLRVPSGATSVKFRFFHRADVGPSGAQKVAILVYNRGFPNNAAVESWSSGHQLTDVDIPTTTEYFQEDEQIVSLSTLGVTAGEETQFEFVRDTADAGDTLLGDWALRAIGFEFI